jgi:PAS domain S-box-containing protein
MFDRQPLETQYTESVLSLNLESEQTPLATQAIAAAASIFVILVGCSVLIGWSFNIAFLKSIQPGWASMKANTALCFIGAGISLGLGMRRGQRNGRRTDKSISQGCAISVFSVGFLTLSQYLFGWNLGIDELLFKDLPLSASTPYPGRMGDNTALNFMLVGAALWLLGQKTHRGHWLAQILALIGSSLALLAIVGYAYGVEVFYSFFFFSTSMALHTALTFAVLCLGILCVRADRGFMQVIISPLNGGTMARQLLPSATIVPLFLGWLIYLGQQAGYYDSAFSLSLLVVSLVALLSAIIWRNASYLNNTDSDRKRFLERLRDSEERLKLAQQAANAGWWDWDLLTDCVTWSPEYYNLFGLDSSVVPSYENWLASVVEEDRSRVERQARESLERQSEFNSEFRVLHPSNGMRWLNAIGRTFYNADGEPIRMTGICLDISDRKLAEKALRDSERRMETLLEIAPVGIFRNDTAGNCFYVNDRCCEIIGLPRAECLGLDAIGGLHPDDRERVFAQWLQAVENNAPFRSEYRFLHRDGTIRWVIGQAIAETDDDGRVVGYIGTATDITALKQAEIARTQAYEELARSNESLQEAMEELHVAEEELRQQTNQIDSERQRYLALFNFAPDGYLVTDTTGKIEEANQAIASLLAVEQKYLLAQPLISFVARDYQAFYRQIERLRESRQQTWEIYLQPLRGQTFPTEVTVAGIYDPLDRLVGLRWLVRDITERKQAQEQLRESEERYRVLAENIPQLVWATAPDGSATYFNQRWLDYTGRSLEENLGWGWSQTLHPDDAASTERIWTTSLATGDRYEANYRMRRFDGSYRWHVARGFPIRDETGTITQWFGTSTDIDDRVKMEESLQESLAILNAINEGTPTLLFAKDRQGRLLMVNANTCNILNLTEAEILNRTDREFFPDVDEAERIMEHDRLVMESGRVEYFEEKVELPEGTRTFLITKFPRRDEAGNVIGLIGIGIDISDRKRAEEKLRENNAILNAINQATTTLIYAKDRQGRLLMANPATIALNGKTESEILGMTTLEFLSNREEAERIMTNDRLVMETGVVQVFEEQVAMPSGRRIYLSTKSPYLDAEGNVIGLIGVSIEITDRKQAELRLEAALELTSELLQERNQEMERFVYIVSHDLKAPLRAIANLSQWIEEDLEGQLEAENQQQMQLLRDRVHRLEALIDGLLAYSRVGRTEVPTEMVDVGALLAEAIDSLAPPATFSIEVRAPMPTLLAKRLLLSQVFANLISNAIKHHDRPDGRIQISAVEKEKYYEFSVTDDGQGIAPEDSEKVFGIFQTLNDNNSKDNTGIGLSIVKKIVETEGGEIFLESELGKGATFRFTLPKQPQSATESSDI